jgi:hypothetical protein
MGATMMVGDAVCSKTWQLDEKLQIYYKRFVAINIFKKKSGFLHKRVYGGTIKP